MQRLVCLPIRQIGRAQLGSTTDKVVDSPKPQGFEISEVTNVFLNGPGVVDANGHDVVRESRNALLQSWRRTAESLHDERKRLERGFVRE